MVAYFLVMGGLALSASLALGWGLWRGLRWGLSVLAPRRSTARRAPAKSTSRPKPQKPTPKKPTSKTKGSPRQAAPRRATPAKAAASRTPRPPHRLVRWLASWRAPLPLAVVASLCYCAARLAEHGLRFRPPQVAPLGYHGIVSGLGWLAAALLLVAVVQALAAWRCRGEG